MGGNPTDGIVGICFSCKKPFVSGDFGLDIGEGSYCCLDCVDACKKNIVVNCSKCKKFIQINNDNLEVHIIEKEFWCKDCAEKTIKF